MGIVGTWGTLLVLDRRRYLNSSIHLGDGRLDAETGALIAQELEGLGITASYDEFTDEDEEGVYVYRGISCRQRDADQVRSVMTRYLASR